MPSYLKYNLLIDRETQHIAQVYHLIINRRTGINYPGHTETVAAPLTVMTLINVMGIMESQSFISVLKALSTINIIIVLLFYLTHSVSIYIIVKKITNNKHYAILSMITNIVFLSKVFVAGVGVDNKYINSISSVINEEVYDACFIGRIHPTKGVYDLIKAWKKVVDRNPNAKIAIIGSGLPEHEEKLRKLINELALQENVKLLGFLPEDEKIRTLSKSRCLIHPSYGECIPLVFLEAASAGVPIITYMLPTYIDIKDYIIPVKIGDINELAEKIYSNCIENNKKQSLKLKLKQYAKSQDWEIVTHRFINFILENTQKNER
jgi:glycosyltransferase involved in cell wall biosynthesis